MTYGELQGHSTGHSVHFGFHPVAGGLTAPGSHQYIFTNRRILYCVTRSNVSPVPLGMVPFKSVLKAQHHSPLRACQPQPPVLLGKPTPPSTSSWGSRPQLLLGGLNPHSTGAGGSRSPYQITGAPSLDSFVSHFGSGFLSEP